MPQDASTHQRAVGGLAGLARDGGAFAMLAIDQRESLRTLLVGAGHGGLDADLSAFKVAVARALSPAASAILVDRDYGLRPIVAANTVAPTCGLIVAVDRFTQAPGGPLEWSELDRPALTDALVEAGATALKFLIVWRPDDPIEPRRILARDFVAACRQLGLASVLEGLVQVPGVPEGPAVDDADPGCGARVRGGRARPVQDPRPDPRRRVARRDHGAQPGDQCGHRPAVGRALGRRRAGSLPGGRRSGGTGRSVRVPGRPRRVGTGHPDRRSGRGARRRRSPPDGCARCDRGSDGPAVVGRHPRLGMSAGRRAGSGRPGCRHRDEPIQGHRLPAGWDGGRPGDARARGPPSRARLGRARRGGRLVGRHRRALPRAGRGGRRHGPCPRGRGDDLWPVPRAGRR